jgi:Tfp pilus assembly protein FimT
MTLIELLVVIIIITTIVAAAIPVLAPADDARRIREAGRSVNTFLTGAQARAIALNRPYGVALKRLAQDDLSDTNRLDPHEDAGVCLEMYYVEQPPPYTGFDSNSRACVALHPNELGLVLVRFVTRGTANNQLPPGWVGDAIPIGVIRPYDVIEINGTRYELLPDIDNPLTNFRIDENGFYATLTGRVPRIIARPVNDSGQQINIKHDDLGRDVLAGLTNAKEPFWTGPAPYKILRQAMPTSDEPYQMPESVAIDLRASGVGDNDYFYWPDVNDNSLGIIIMFTPEGRVSRVSYSEAPYADVNDPLAFDQPVTDNIYLLLGKRENIPAPSSSNDATLSRADYTAAASDEKRTELKDNINWLSGNSSWVVIGSQSGRIATIENASVDPITVIDRYTQNPTLFAERSEEMRCAQILAAREFTRETAQLGGR